MHSSEALARWEKDDNHIMSPAIFIPILEEYNKICDFDFYMLEKICKSIISQLERGLAPVKVSVNFSKYHFNNPNFTTRIVETLKKYNVNPKYIEIELTESAFENYEKIEKHLNYLHKKNISVAIDDFGKGYSSLGLLEKIKADTIKIDKSFVDSIGTVSGNTILKHTVSMLKELNKNIVCEGVETKEQLEFLKRIKCSLIQGYYYDKPLPEKNYEKRLINKKYEF